MRVYGDRRRRADPREEIERLEAALAALPSRGLARHAALVSVFIGAGQLMQGLADADFAETGRDGPSSLWAAGEPALLALARAVDTSWTSGFERRTPLPGGLFRQLAARPLPACVEIVDPEGHAFYAVYPEAYAEAARGVGRRIDRVVGIRSIGVGLGAMVAAATGAGEFVTMRPVGHPFDRRVEPDPAWAARLGPKVTAVADEGPGLSGSSFGAVLDFLGAHGTPADLVEVFPSHGGDLGPMAGAERRARWAALPRHVVDFDALALGPLTACHGLAAWLSPLIGSAVGPLQDISGGAWRESRPEPWPASNVQQERRKFLLTTAEGRFLARFAGLGRAGERAAERARILAEIGATPPYVGFAHGFVVERWVEGRPLDPQAVDPVELGGAVGRYLGLRARALPAMAEDGASVEELHEMARINASEALGQDAAERMGLWASRLPTLAGLARRAHTDNKLDAHEWLVAPGGRLVKTDAIDHCAAHDLVGCQDLAWDVVGAEVELGLGAEASAALRREAADASGQPVHDVLAAFYLPCYLAFRCGAAQEGARALTHTAEARRLEMSSRRYADALAAALDHPDNP
jgi:hypothetical protein